MSKKKCEALGMNHGAAAHQLRKNILFHLLEKLEMNVCFQCNRVIVDTKDLSIEHKDPWMSAKDPKNSFFDLDNIAFSHLTCNISAAQKPQKKYFTSEEKKMARARYAVKQRSGITEERRKEIRRSKYLRSGH